MRSQLPAQTNDADSPVSEPNPYPTCRYERVIALLLVLVVLPFIGLYFYGMATSSLWTDELGSVKFFFARGPLVAATDYSLARNHIFFSVLNSLLPGCDSVQPFRARVLSFLFAALTGGTILQYFWGKKWWLEGALFFWVWGMNGGLLQQSLEARGYGLVCLLTLWSGLCLYEYATSGRRSWFAWLVVCGVLGIYTLPSYVLFVGPLMVFAAVLQRDRKALWWIAAGAAATGLLYAPVVKQVVKVAGMYKSHYGEQYGSLDAVLKTFRDFVCPAPNWVLLFLIGLSMAIPFCIRDKKNARVSWALTGAVYLFLAACLWLRTPPVRTTCFVLFPLGLSAVLLLRERVLYPRLLPVGLAVLAIAAVGASMVGIQQFQLVPDENWSEPTALIEAAFPPFTIVDISDQAEGVSYYIDQDKYRLSMADRKSIRGPLFLGRSPIVSGRWKEQRTPLPQISATTPIVTVGFEGKIRDVFVRFAEPSPSGNFTVRCDGRDVTGVLTDLDQATVVRQAGEMNLEFAVHLQVWWNSLNLLFEADPGDVSVTAHCFVDKSHPAIPLQCKRAGRWMVFTLPKGEDITSVSVHLTGGADLKLSEAWFNSGPQGLR
jgi:hypothetical protein